MYCLSEQQIDFILHDIRARGIQMEDLQLNLLDHICIIIEQNLEESGDFERFYAAAITAFYKQDLREIEEETIFLLTHKNNYSMKKAMIITGVFSVTAFIGSALCKLVLQHMRDFLLFLGFTSFIFLFVPLVFIVKFRESTSKPDRLILVSGTIAGVLYGVCMLLNLFHWRLMEIPWLILWLTGLAVAFFVFIPAYFFRGIRNPETKANTIIVTILMVVVTTIQFQITNLRPHIPVKPPTAIQAKPPVEKGVAALIK